MLTNYHTHCYRCNHAEGSEADYVNMAVEKGFDILGMSDHVPYPGNLEGLRMGYEEIDDYIDTVRELADANKDKIEVLVGFESEFLSARAVYYERLLNFYNVDYLILGQHFFDYKGGSGNRNAYFLSDSEDCIVYAQTLAEGMSTGYYSMVAHPDIVGVNQHPWDKNLDKMTDIIINAAVKYDMPLEFNANGLRRGVIENADGLHYMYPHYKFWEKAAEAGIKTVIGADCHSPKLLLDDYVERGKEIAASWGLNVIDVLPIGKNK